MTDQHIRPSWRSLFVIWTKIGFLSFGGPAAQIAMIHRIAVDDQKWLSEQRFLNALSFCMLLPGPEAMQVATYIGWRVRGVWGGLLTGGLFVLPGAMIIFGLALLYASYAQDIKEYGIFAGINAAVLGIVIHALYRMATRNLKSAATRGIALLSFVSLFFLNLPFPIVIIASALAGYLMIDAAPPTPVQTRTAPVAKAAQGRRPVLLKQGIIWACVWAVPLICVSIWSDTPVLGQLSLYFSQLALVSFGGAYAALAYMTQAAVDTYGWVTPEDMLNALGLAETTPGPLILVTQFVGIQAGLNTGSLSTGLIAGCVTLWATFIPCFMWVFLGAPYIDALDQNAHIRAALAGIMAAVVGVMINLSVWFGLRILFQELTAINLGPVDMPVPSLDTLQLWPLVMVSCAVAFLAWRPTHILLCLALCASLGRVGAYMSFL